MEEKRVDHGIVDADVFNFDKTGFSIGNITPSMVVTRADWKGKAKSTYPSNREWSTVN